jgi:hypothetical protein
MDRLAGIGLGLGGSGKYDSGKRQQNTVQHSLLLQFQIKVVPILVVCLTGVSNRSRSAQVVRHLDELSVADQIMRMHGAAFDCCQQRRKLCRRAAMNYFPLFPVKIRRGMGTLS